MRCPNPPGECRACVCKCVQRQWNTSVLDLIRSKETLSHVHTHTYTHSPGKALLVVIHNTRPARKPRLLFFLPPKKRKRKEKLSRGHRGGEILIPIIYQLPVSGEGNARDRKSWKTSAQYYNPTLRGASKRCSRECVIGRERTDAAADVLSHSLSRSRSLSCSLRQIQNIHALRFPSR